MIFLRLSLFDFHTDDSNTNLQSVKKNVSLKIHTYVFGITFLSISQKNFIFENIKFTSPFSIPLFSKLKTAKTIGSLRNYDPLKQYHLFFTYPNKSFLIDLWSSHRSLLFPVTLHVLILTAFHSQLLNRIHKFRKFLTTDLKINLWKYFILLSAPLVAYWTPFSDNSISWFLCKSKIDIFKLQISIFFLRSSYLFCISFRK